MTAIFTTTSSRTSGDNMRYDVLLSPTDTGGTAGIVLSSRISDFSAGLGPSTTATVQPTGNFDDITASDIAEYSAILTGGYYFESPAYDQPQDFWIKNAMHEGTTADIFDWDDIWLYVEEITTPTTGWTAGTSAFNTWLNMNTQQNINYSFDYPSSQILSELGREGVVKIYGLEKTTTPTGNPTAEGATLISSTSNGAQIKVRGFNEGGPG